MQSPAVVLQNISVNNTKISPSHIVDTVRKHSVDPKRFKMILPKISSVVMENGILYSLPKSSCESSTSFSKRDHVQVKPFTSCEKNDSQNDDKADVRRSKRKRLPKIKSDEPYKRKRTTPLKIDPGEKAALTINQIKSSCIQEVAKKAANTSKTILLLHKEHFPVMHNVQKILKTQSNVKSQNEVKTLNISNTDTTNLKSSDNTLILISQTLNCSNANDSDCLNSDQSQKDSLSVCMADSQSTDKTMNKSQQEKHSKSPRLTTTGPQNFENEAETKHRQTTSCFKCASVFDTKYVIVFKQRFYCCRECLPAETTREMRLGTIIKHCHESVTPRDRKTRRSPKNYALIESLSSGTCTTPNCDGTGHINRKYQRHKSVSSCPNTVKKLKKRLDNHENILSCNKELTARENSDCDQINRTVCKTDPNSDLQAEHQIKLPRKEKLKCPLPDCDGQGHTNGKFPTHRSIFGCPLAKHLTKQATGTNRCPNPHCDSIGSTVPEQTYHTSLMRCPKLVSDNNRHCIVQRNKTAKNTERISSTGEKVTNLNESDDNNHETLLKEATLLKINNTEVKDDIASIKKQLRMLESEGLVADERIDELLVQEYHTKNELREQRTRLENAIRLASIPLSFSDIAATEHEQFFERLKNYFSDKHTSIYREKLKSFLGKV